uniref:Transcription factor A, mitochondrial n=1 Tax=Lygus hesperus TaxID=30085 RepID=A0A0A9XF38_LYGHE
MLSLISRFNGLNLSYHRAITCHRISSSPQSRRITLEDKIGIRPKPKRPMSAFLKFSSNIVRPNLIKDNPSLPITQVTKIAAERWKSVDDDTKKKLAKEYQDEMVGYRAAMVEYLKELSTVDSKLLEKHDPKLRKEKLALKKKRFELGCPKRPLTAYLSYLQTRRSEQGNVPYKVPNKMRLAGASEDLNLSNPSLLDQLKTLEWIPKWNANVARRAALSVSSFFALTVVLQLCVGSPV